MQKDMKKDKLRHEKRQIRQIRREITIYPRLSKTAIFFAKSKG